LTRSIGKGESVLVDCLTFEVIPEDTLFLCSDGLWASFPEPNDFLKPFQGNSPKEKSQNIATYCVENRLKKDDVSIVLVDVKADESKVLKREEALGELVSLKIETLQQVYLFSELSMSEIYKLLAISKLLEFQAGDLIIEQGERSASLFIILEGEVQILRNQKEISRFNKGQHFGEMAFFSNEARTASAKSLSDSRLIQIEQEAFASLIRRDSHIAISSLWKLASELSSRLQVSNEHLDFCAPKK
jgi:CRP-like cAMP-binding protein